MKKFWKIFLIILIILISLLFIAVIGGYIFLKNFDVKKYKPQITDAASKAMGRPVDFADISLTVSLTDGVRLKLQNLTIDENPAFGTQPFVAVDHIDIGVDLLGFLKFKNISIPNITIDHPQIRLIRDNSGMFNAQTIGQKSASPAIDNKASAPAAIPAFFIQSLAINNGNILLSDTSDANPSKISIDQIHLTIKKFVLNGNFPLTLDASLAGTEPNIHVDSTIKIDLSRSSLHLSNLNTSINLDKLSWKQLREFSLIPAGTPLPQDLGGQIKISSQSLSVSDKGITDGNVSLNWSAGILNFANAAPGISIQAENINLDVRDYSLTTPKPFHITLKTALFSNQPNIDLNATINMDPKTSALSLNDASFKTDLTLWNWDVLKKNIAQLKDSPSPERLSGKLDVSIKTLNTDASGLKNILADLTFSNGSILVRNLIPASILDISETNLTVRNFSLDQPFNLSLTTGLFNDRPNVSVDGKISLDIAKQLIRLNDTSIKINLDSLPMTKIQTSGLIPTGTPLPDSLKGNIIANIKQFESSPKGLSQLLIDAEWQNGMLVMKNIAPGISVSAQNINIKTIGFSLDKPFEVQGSLAYENTTPNITFKSRVAMSTAQQNLHLSDGNLAIDLSQLSLNNIRSAVTALKEIPLPKELSGKINIDFADLSTDAQGLQNILMNISLTDGLVNFPQLAEGVAFSASHINTDIKNFSLNKPFDFTLNLAYLDDNQNIFTKGTAQLNLAEQSVHLQKTSIKTDLSHIALNDLKTSIVALKNAPLPEMLKGQFNILINDALSGPQGLKTLAAQGTLKNASIKMKEMAIPVDNLNIEFESTDQDLTIKTMTASLGQGNITAHADIKDFLTRQQFSAVAQIKNIALKDLADQSQAPVKIEGLLSGDITLSGLAANPKSFNGAGTLSSTQTLIKDLNVLKTILDKISFLPGLAQNLQEGLPQRYQDKLKDKDTTIQKAEFVLAIVDGNITINPMDIQAEEFTFGGTTQASLDQSYAVNGIFTIPTELALAMAKTVSEMQYLLDANQAISLPVNIKGQGANPPQFAVDAVMKDVTKKILSNVAEEQLLKLFGVSENSSPTTAEPVTQSRQTPQNEVDQSSSGQQQKQPADPTNELINSVLGSVFN